ncbi:hypothetical protein BDV93DRAFT_565949 [Ceratobasidium sp. AG-I]|nr:hypothetical protein BDV93DRAFT_565949 [Ceratobasidium sp. AG-I]
MLMSPEGLLKINDFDHVIQADWHICTWNDVAGMHIPDQAVPMIRPTLGTRDGKNPILQVPKRYEHISYGKQEEASQTAKGAD